MSSNDTLMKRENAMKQKGYVYLLTNPWIRDPNDKDCPLVKIGAAIDFDNRMGSLNSAVPCDFVIEMAVNTEVWRDLETVVHNDSAFREKRIGKSEFFRIDAKAAKKNIRRIAETYCKEKGVSRPNIMTKIVQLGRSAAAVRSNRDALFSGKIKFICRRGGSCAVGHFESEKVFVVEKGSCISRNCADSFPHSMPRGYYIRWKEIIEKGLDGNGKLRNDERFSSRAFAASVVCGSSRNGNDEWVKSDDDHITLGKYFGK